MNKKIVVIGGGAAGMMAALSAAEQGAQVTLLEPNERLGKKLNITGKGRCNVTNNTDIEGLLANIPCNGKFLYSAFNRFNSADTMNFFEKLGVQLKTERGNRVFPVSDSAFDISAALERRLKALKVQVLRDRASALKIEDGAVCGVVGERGRYSAQAVVLATGGVSYPATGSTGDGHRMAAEAGHTVTPLQGSLVPLQGIIAAGIPCVRLQGLSLRNVSLTVFENDKKIYTDFGELLFTHFGVSGPLVLSASAHMRHFTKKRYRLEIDLKPALDEQQLDKRLLADFAKYANHDFQNGLDDLLPQKLIPVVVELSGIPGRQKVHDLTREQRQSLLRVLKHFPVEVSGPCPVEDAIVTSGGVKVGEVDPKTMESKLVKNLYFAGELLNRMDNKRYAVAIDGPSGAGKSTLAKSVSKTLGYLYVDTGAIYRPSGYAAFSKGVAPKDGEAVAALLPELEIGLHYGEDGLQHMTLNGTDVTDQIRLPEISLYASAVSAHPAVRAHLLEMQRKLARENNVVMDGRDIGTVVLPDATVKIFLTASVEERAMRRFRELEQRGTPESYEKVLEEMRQRDYNDSHRAAAPLKQAEDAVLLDTTELDFHQSEEAILRIIRERTSR